MEQVLVSTQYLLPKKVGKNGKVFAFEPEPTNYNSLVRNISLNNLQNVIPVKLGLSNSEKVIKLYRNERDEGMHSLAQINKHNYVKIQTITLDAFCTEYSISRVDFLKIDIEGAEVKALQGMKNILGTLSPKILIEVVEHHLRAMRTSEKDLRSFLERLGYTIYEFTSKGIMKLNSNQKRKQPNIYLNLFCIKE